MYDRLENRYFSSTLCRDVTRTQQPGGGGKTNAPLASLAAREKSN